MASFWDKVERRQRLAADRGTELRDLQIELWGWCDERLRDGRRTKHNGWAGNLVKPRRQNGHNEVCSEVMEPGKRGARAASKPLAMAGARPSPQAEGALPPAYADEGMN
jgi:hypothetical protein